MKILLFILCWLVTPNTLQPITPISETTEPHEELINTNMNPTQEVSLETISGLLQAMNIREEDDLDTAISYNNIADEYANRGNYEEAIRYYRQAFSIQRKVAREDHLTAATFYSNLGKMHYLQGNLEEAINYFTELVKIREKWLGSDHPDTVFSRDQLKQIESEEDVYNKQGL